MSRPNIVMILTDQHNPKIAGYEEDPWVETPTLDGIAARGTRFRNAYCQAPLCVPSRMSMLTGQHCRTLGIYDNRDCLPANSLTFPRVLSATGYRTCLIGKAHLNGDQFQGFQQRPYGDLFGQAHQPDPRRLPENHAHGLGDIPYQAGPSRIPLPLTQTEICVAETTRWLQEHVSLHAPQPFFLAVHFDKPHFPINPPGKLFEKYMDLVKLSDHWDGEHGADHLERLSPFVRSNFVDEGYYNAPPEAHRRTLAAYYGCVEWIDSASGRILDVLDYLGLAGNTIVVYASDHGEMASAHGAWQKMVFYEESARVPLLAAGPAICARVVEQPVGLVDLFPTFCELAGAAIPDSCEGTSLVPAMRGDSLAARDVYSESVLINKPAHAGCMLRRDNWKYIRYLDGVEELYDLATDPAETRNCVADYPERWVREFRDAVERFWRPKEQLSRYHATPRMPREKHFYPYSNQFFGANGAVFDGRP